MTSIERHNKLCNALGEGLWGFGASLAAALTVLPLLIRRMGGSETEVGLISAVGNLGIILPQVASSFILQRGAGRKRFLLLYHALLLVPIWAGMGLVSLLLAERHPVAARALLLTCLGLFMLAVGFIVPAWVDFVAALFRYEIRGSAYGWSNFAAAAGGVGAALVAGAVARTLPYPVNYATLFMGGAVVYLASIAAFSRVRELARPAARRLAGREIFGKFVGSLLEPNFRRYLVARVLLTLGAGPVFFLAVRYRSAEGGGLPEETVIALGAVIALSQAAAGFLLGRLGDRFGHRTGALVGATAQVGATSIAILAPGFASCAAAFAFVGAVNAAMWVSHNNLLIESCPHDCRAVHVTVSSLVLAPVAATVPVVAGRLIEAFGSGTVFTASLAASAAGLAWLILAVREPRALLLKPRAPAAGDQALPVDDTLPE